MLAIARICFWGNLQSSENILYSSHLYIILKQPHNHNWNLTPEEEILDIRIAIKLKTFKGSFYSSQEHFLLIILNFGFGQKIACRIGHSIA